jgi:hypothetical protein
MAAHRSGVRPGRPARKFTNRKRVLEKPLELYFLVFMIGAFARIGKEERR